MRSPTRGLIAAAFIGAGIGVASAPGVVHVHAAGPFVSAAASACSSVPHAFIVTSKKTSLANYYPRSISVKVSTTLSFCITNGTTASQSVTVQGGVLATVAAGKTTGILCNIANKATFGLSSNPKAAMAVTCTA